MEGVRLPARCCRADFCGVMGDRYCSDDPDPVESEDGATGFLGPVVRRSLPLPMSTLAIPQATPLCRW